MMNLSARMPSVVPSSTSSNPVMTSYGYQDPGQSVASDDRSGKPENSSPPGYSKEDYGRSWSSQEWKSGAAEHDRSGKPETTSWDMMQKVATHREEPLLGRNAHSARYGETIHDRTGETCVSALPRAGKFRKFRHGQWRSRICEQSQRPSAKQTEKDVERCKVRWRAFNNMGNVHGYNVKCGDSHGKEFLNYSKCCQESWTSHVETNVRCHRSIGD